MIFEIIVEVSIGHVKGQILPGYRNIYCATGVIHLVDAVLGVPSRSAYQEIANNQELSIMRSIIDRSPKYKALLNQQIAFNYNTNQQNVNQGYNTQRAMRYNVPVNNDTNTQHRQRARQVTPLYDPLMQQQHQQPMQSQLTNINQQGYNMQQQQQQDQMNRVNPLAAPYPQMNFAGNPQYVTVLAPRDASLLAIRDTLLANDSAIEEFLSYHIIVDVQGGVKVFYTDHDDNVFVSGQTYSTRNPNFQLVATVIQNPSIPSNVVTLSPVQNPSIVSRITYGNTRVMNGVVHVVDKPLAYLANYDITSILDKYATINSPGIRPFNQFVDILRSTGIFNDLRQPAKQYTLFIPTNDALARYQDILNSNDLNRKKNVIIYF
jgi:hypothetical protein